MTTPFYQDSLFTIIRRTLDEEKHYSISLNDHLSLPSDESDKNLDEKAMQQILQHNFTSNESLSSLRSMFNLVFMHHHIPDSSHREKTIPYLDKSIMKYLNSLHLASQDNSTEGYAVLANFKSASDLVILKTSKYPGSGDYTIMYEYFLGVMGVNKLRRLIPNFSYILSIFKCNPLLIEQVNPNTKVVDMDHFCSSPQNSRFYVIYEKIPGPTIFQYINTFLVQEGSQKFILYLLSLLLGLQVAQEEISFVHYDLHTSNVILRTLDKPRIVHYKIGSIQYSLTLDRIPTVIDYGFSHFVFKDIPFGLFHRPELGITSTLTYRAYDMYKFVMYSLFHIFNKTPSTFFQLSWLLEFYKDEDIFGIYKAVKTPYGNQQFQHEAILKAFKQGNEKFFALSFPDHHRSMKTPLDLITWILKHKAFRGTNISQSPLSIKTVKDIPSLVETYQDKIQSYSSIFRQPWIDNLDTCHELFSTKHQSFVYNQYLITQFEEIMRSFPKHFIGTDKFSSQLSVLSKVTIEHKDSYLQNDHELLDIYDHDLQTLSASLDMKHISQEIESYVAHKIRDPASLHPTVHHLQEYISLFTNYKLFLYYSTFSHTFHGQDKFFAFYLFCQAQYNKYVQHHRESIFVYLNDNLSNFNHLLVDTIDNKSVNILHENWVMTPEIDKAIHTLPKIFIDIYCDYPEMTYAFISIEDSFYRILLDLHFVVKPSHTYYIPPSSRHQIKLIRDIHPNGLFTLLQDYVDYTLELRTQMETTIMHSRDHAFYDQMKKYKHKYLPLKIAQQRLLPLEFLFNIPEFLSITADPKSVKYLDFTIDDSSTALLFATKSGISPHNTTHALTVSSPSNYDIPRILYQPYHTLPFMDKVFNVITVFSLFHLIIDLPTFMKEIHRILLPYGLLIVQEYTITNVHETLLADIDHCLDALVRKEKSSSFLHTYWGNYRSFDQWDSLFIQYGFKYLAYFALPEPENPTRKFYTVYRKLE